MVCGQVDHEVRSLWSRLGFGVEVARIRSGGARGFGVEARARTLKARGDAPQG